MHTIRQMVCDDNCYSAALPKDGRKAPVPGSAFTWPKRCRMARGEGISATSPYVGRRVPMNKAINAGERRAIRTAAALYGAVWLACLALYWGSLATGGLGGGAIMGYTLLVLYVVLPVAGAVASFLVGRARGLGGVAAPVPACVCDSLPRLHRRDVRPLDGARPHQHRPRGRSHGGPCPRLRAPRARCRNGLRHARAGKALTPHACVRAALSSASQPAPPQGARRAGRLSRGAATRYNRRIGDENTTPSGSRGAGAARQ